MCPSLLPLLALFAFLPLARLDMPRIPMPKPPTLSVLATLPALSDQGLFSCLRIETDHVQMARVGLRLGLRIYICLAKLTCALDDILKI